MSSDNEIKLMIFILEHQQSISLAYLSLKEQREKNMHKNVGCLSFKTIIWIWLRNCSLMLDWIIQSKNGSLVSRCHSVQAVFVRVPTQFKLNGWRKKRWNVGENVHDLSFFLSNDKGHIFSLHWHFDVDTFFSEQTCSPVPSPSDTLKPLFCHVSLPPSARRQPKGTR